LEASHLTGDGAGRELPAFHLPMTSRSIRSHSHPRSRQPAFFSLDGKPLCQRNLWEVIFSIPSSDFLSPTCRRSLIAPVAYGKVGQG
jgi:hypothetical protein